MTQRGVAKARAGSSWITWNDNNEGQNMTATYHTIAFWTKFRSQYSWLGFGKSMRGSVIVLICLLFLPGSASADYYDGLRAFDSADYALAASEWHTAASQGDLTSQYRLAQLYEQGVGVPQDFVQAHRWYNFAASQGHAEARNARDALANRMTADQLAEAQKLVTQSAVLPQVELKQPALPPADQPALPSVGQEAAPVPTNLPKRIQQEIGRWADHPFQRLPAAQFDTARWESRGFKQWINVIFRSGPYAVFKTHSTYAQGPDQDQLVVYLGIERLSAVASTDAKDWTRRTLGFSDIKPLRPSSTAIPIGDVRPQDLSVEYKWDIRIGSDERNFNATWRVTGVTEAGVTVNGIDFRLPAFEVAYVLQNRYRLYRLEMTFKYVPVLGVRVEGEGMVETSGQTKDFSGRLTDVRVSEEVLSRVRAAAL